MGQIQSRHFYESKADRNMVPYSGSNILPEAPVSSSGRYAWADLCRVFAIYGVVLIHACGASFYQYDKLPVSTWLQSVILDSLVRCSVPLFVMLSGALILVSDDHSNIDDELNQIPRRLFRVLLPLLVWSGAYLMHVRQNGEQVDLTSIFVRPAMYHLWFVYMIVGIYLLLPILKSIFLRFRESTALQIYFAIIWFVVTTLPVYWNIPLVSLLQQHSMLGYGGYFLIGAFIVARNGIPFSTLTWLFIFLVNVAITVFLTWYLSIKVNAPDETAFLYFSPNVVFASIAAFVIFGRLKISDSWSRVLQFLSNLSFFVYFSHVFVLEYVRYSGVISDVSKYLPLWILILLISLTTFFISLCFAALVRLIPGGGRLFG